MYSSPVVLRSTAGMIIASASGGLPYEQCCLSTRPCRSDRPAVPARGPFNHAGGSSYTLAYPPLPAPEDLALPWSHEKRRHIFSISELPSSSPNNVQNHCSSPLEFQSRTPQCSLRFRDIMQKLVATVVPSYDNLTLSISSQYFANAQSMLSIRLLDCTRTPWLVRGNGAGELYAVWNA